MASRVSQQLTRRRALDLKRRLMRSMARLPWRQAELIAIAVREQAAAVAFSQGRSIDNLCNDIDQGAAWERARMETAIRNRFATRR